MSLEAGAQHRLEMGVLNGYRLQPSPQIDVRTYNESGAFCGLNVSLGECSSRNETLTYQRLSSLHPAAADDAWQTEGEEALLIRLFRLATAFQTTRWDISVLPPEIDSRFSSNPW